MGRPYQTSNTDHDDEGLPTGSQKYLPENIHGVELYDEVCDWIDHVLGLGEIEHDFLILDELVEQLITIFKDKESLAAYYNLFVRSIIGTRSALDFLLDLLQFEPRGEWKEWFELDWPLPPYKLIVDFGDEYPHHKDPLVRYIDWDKLLDLFELIKNERTLIAQVRMQDCANMLIFDYGSFDNELFDNLQGYVYRGVRFCLYEKHRQLLYKNVNFFLDFQEMRTTYHNRLYIHTLAGALDYMYLDEPYWYYMFFYTFQTHIYFQLIEVEDPSESPYHWGTWTCQVVLDDYEELSNGTGFPGDTLVMDTFYLSGDEVLDDVVGEWVAYGCEYGYTSYFFDFSADFVLAWYWSRAEARLYTTPLMDPFQLGFYQFQTTRHGEGVEIEYVIHSTNSSARYGFLLSPDLPTVFGYLLGDLFYQLIDQSAYAPAGGWGGQFTSQFGGENIFTPVAVYWLRTEAPPEAAPAAVPAMGGGGGMII